jgi:diacylglycerol diphosphate phosphatase/phosphatidate phosphatase
LAIIVAAIFALVFYFLPPFERKFNLIDQSISFPHLDDIVPFVWVAIFAVAVPFLLFLSVTRSILYSVQIYQQYVLGLATTEAITEMVKVTAGRLRPDFLDRCKPNPSLKCTGDANSVLQGRKSFFSGHSSISFYCMGFMVFWMLREGWNILKVRSNRRNLNGVVFLSTLLPFLLPLYVALSRVQQNVHHVEDVMAGSLFGLYVSYVIHTFYHRNNGE